MHRISHERERSEELFYKENKLSMGWSILTEKYGDELINIAQNKERNEFVKRFVEIGQEINNEWLTSRRSSYLYNFLRLKSGDIVVVPFGGVISICEITAQPVRHVDDKGKDIGFVVEFKLLKDKISKYEYVNATLNSKLKFQGTNLVFNEYDQNLVNEIINNKEGVPIYNFGQTKKKIVSQVQDYIMNNLKESHFELLIKAYLENVGADLAVIPSKNEKNINNSTDADIDVKALFSNLGVTIYVQAKHHWGITDRTGIDQLIGYREDNDDRFNLYPVIKWLVTTGSLSTESLELAKENNIRVVQEEQFAELLINTGFKFDEKYCKK